MKWNGWLSLLLLLPAVTTGQIKEPYQIYRYNVNEGLLQSTISDICFDSENYLWIGFPNGLQRFDGIHFNRVPVQPGLPDDGPVRFFRTSRQDLLIYHKQGISRYVQRSKQFIEIYRHPVGAEGTRQFIGEVKGMVFFLTPSGSFGGINIHTFEPTDAGHPGIPCLHTDSNRVVKFSSNILDDAVAFSCNKRIYRWHLTEKKLLDSSAAIPGIYSYFLYQKSPREVCYTSHTDPDALRWYHFDGATEHTLNLPGMGEMHLNRVHVYQWGNRPLLVLSNRIFETKALASLEKELVSFQFEPAGSSHSIAKITEDNFGNLWLQTVTGGLIKVCRKIYPIRYYGTSRKELNNTMCVLPDKSSNRILAGTVGNGLLIFDTSQRLIRHIRLLPGHRESFTVNVVIKNNGGGYLVFVNGETCIWKLSQDLRTFSSFPVLSAQPGQQTGIHFFGNFLSRQDQRLLVQTQGRIYKLVPAASYAREFEFSNAYIMSGIEVDNRVITHGRDELLLLDTVAFRVVKRVPFPHTSDVRCFARGGGDTLYAGTNKGIFCFDINGRLLYHLDRTSGLPDECIYAMAVQPDGAIWCSSNRGLFRVSPRRQVLHLKKGDGLQDNEYNTNAVAMAPDGELFFAGVNGINSFYPGQIHAGDEIIEVSLSSVKVNNRELMTGTPVSSAGSITIPYHNNVLSFTFSVMGPLAAEDYVCQYRMAGIDRDWIAVHPQQAVHYSLPPGNYTLQMFASRGFNPGALPMQELQIRITPPFWKTWWFVLSAAVLVILLVAAVVVYFSKRRYTRRLMQLEAERKLQAERERISRELHDSIGAYANAVLYNAELLQQHDQHANSNLIQGLRGLSKDIITALRDNVWALKSSGFTAEECLLRIRNFVQSLNRYYHHTELVVEGEAPARRLDSTHALHLIRMVQEALTNAVRHASASEIRVESSLESGQWKLCIRDNGTGFETPEGADETDTNGLANMRNRAAEAGFGFFVDSTPGSGTRVCILV